MPARVAVLSRRPDTGLSLSAAVPSDQDDTDY